MEWRPSAPMEWFSPSQSAPSAESLRWSSVGATVAHVFTDSIVRSSVTFRPTAMMAVRFIHTRHSSKPWSSRLADRPRRAGIPDARGSAVSNRAWLDHRNRRHRCADVAASATARRQAGDHGIGRNGTPGGNNSGDVFLAFSIANDFPTERMRGASQSMSFIPDDSFDAFYLARSRMQ